MAASHNVSVPVRAENVAAAGAHTNSLLHGNRTAVGIRIGGAGDLWLIPVGGGAQYLYASSVLAGEQFGIQFDGIGASSTCTKLTISFNDHVGA